MSEYQLEDNIPVIIHTDIPNRNPPTLVLLTTTRLTTKVHVEEALTDKLILYPGNKEIDEKARPLLLYLMEKGLPEPLRIKIKYEIKGDCNYQIGAIVLLLKHLIEALEKYYNEQFELNEKQEIIEGILSNTPIKKDIIEPLVKAVIEKKNILYSITQGPIFMEEKKIDCIVLSKEKSVKKQKIDERVADILAKTASIAIAGLGENLCLHTGKASKLHNKLINAIWYITHEIIPPGHGIYTISYENTVQNIICSEKPEGNGV